MKSETEEVSGVCQKCGTSLSDCLCREVEKGDTLAVRELKLHGVSTTGEYYARPMELQDEFERRYEVIRKIGAGGMGTVYEAEHVVLRKRVALKVLKQTLAADRLAIARFEREAQACASLQHPNLMQVFDCGVTTDGSPYLVMEYIEGRNIAKVIKDEKKLGKDAFFEVFVPACNALAYAHSIGVIHRDLKPENIVLTRGMSGEEVPKLVDFGIAKVEEMGGQLQVLTQTGELLGSPSYMSPEQCTGKPVDGRTDVYSLGCVMYEALTGKKAFYGENISTLLFEQMRREPNPPEKVNTEKDELTAAVGGIIMKCLVKDADNRIQSMTELRDRLLEAQGQLRQKRVLGFRLPQNATFDNKVIIAALLPIVLVVVATVGSIVLFQDKEKKSAEPPAAVQSKSGSDNSPLVLLSRGLYMKKDHLSASDSSMHQALAIAKQGRAPDVEQVAIAHQLMESYASDTWQPPKAMAVFKEVSPALERLSARLAASPENGPYAYTGVAPLVYLLAARSRWQDNDYKKSVAFSKKGIELTRGQPEGAWMAARLNSMQGEALFHLKKFDEAQKCFQSSLDAEQKFLGSETNQNVAENYRFLAKIEMERGHYEKARDLTQRGIALLQGILTENWRIARDYTPQLQKIEELKNKAGK
jgi:Serine/threonine protein kinase